MPRLTAAVGGNPMTSPSMSVWYSNAEPFHAKIYGQLESCTLPMGCTTPPLPPVEELELEAVDASAELQSGVPGTGQTHLPP